MSILQVTARWSGFLGEPGYTNLYFTNAGVITTAVDNAVSAVHDFMYAFRFSLPSAVSIQVEQEVKELDPATGALVGLHSAGSVPALVQGIGGDSGPLPSGLVISWGTGGVNRGRRVRGRTFIVPLAATGYQSDGTLTADFLANARATATSYRTSAAYEALIWSRPRAGAGGAAFPILTSSVPDMAAVLRSRRD